MELCRIYRAEKKKKKKKETREKDNWTNGYFRTEIHILDNFVLFFFFILCI